MDEVPVYKKKIFWKIAGAFVLTLSPLIVAGVIILWQRLSEPPPSLNNLNNPLGTEARKFGYDIIWISPRDTTGRTVFYQDRSKADMNFRGAGLILTQIASQSGQPAHKVVSYIAGTLISFEKIVDSKDVYVDLINPQTGLTLPKVRLIFTKNDQLKTSFRIENLSYGEYQPFDRIKIPEGDLGILADWTFEDFQKITETGDALVVSVASKDQENRLINPVDQNNQLIANILVIRRFNGRQQLEKEIQL